MALTSEQDRALLKIFTAMGSLKVAVHALQSKDMNGIEEDVADSLRGVIRQFDDAYMLIAEPNGESP